MAKTKVKALVKNFGYEINEAGDVIELDFSNEIIKSLTEQGLIEEIEKPTPKSKAKK